MATSQFKVYRSQDAGAPILSGTSGSLVNVLTQCLVTGYGTQVAAGWTADYTSSTNSGSAFRPASGSRFYLSVQDDARSAGTTKDARLRGFETLSSFDTGSGQFPSTGQGITGGYVSCRKSLTADALARAWVIYADAYTMYLFITTGDGSQFGTFFGDIYSYKTTTDTYRCMIVGSPLENSALGGTSDTQTATPTTGHGGHFMARTYGGGGTSITIGKQGDIGSGTTTLAGLIQYPNGPDNAMYMAPVRIVETTPGTVRGRMRGMYHICHAIASFSDGDIFQGANDFQGKTFQVVKQGAGGMWAIEISNSVESN